MAALLKKLGFSVTLKTNARLQEMDEAIEELGNRLKKGGVGLFYYAGHGVQVNGTNYLLPIGAKINKEADVKYQAVDANKILDEMATANNGLNIVMLDACRDNPYARSFRNAARGLAIVSSAPSGTFISYSTSPGNVARDGDGRNSPYTAALIKFMQEPGLTISDVFIYVRTKLKKETGQVPWELSSLEGQFYFVPGSGKTVTDSSSIVKQTKKTKPTEDNTTDALDLAMSKIQQKKEDEENLKAERQEQFKALLADVKKYKIIVKEDIDAETKAAAWKALTKKYPSWSAGVETGKADKIVLKAIAEDKDGGFNKFDGRFIANADGTVLDTRTNLMWAARDNGSNINWANAKSYCENYRGGGYTDWRMPTQDELAGLYDGSIAGNNGYYLTTLITLTRCCPWASETRGSDAAHFHFDHGKRYWNPKSNDIYYRAVPVRSGK